jgi:phosphonate transport system permease protein
MSAAVVDAAIADLRRRRPVQRLLRVACGALSLLTVWAWLGGTFDFSDFGTERSARNVTRFLHDVRPYPLQDGGWNAGTYVAWLRETLGASALHAMVATLAMSIVAIALAGTAAALVAWIAARNWASAEPFLPGTKPPPRAVRIAWRVVPFVTRAVLIFARAIPEYVWGFLFLAFFGLGPWAPVLALAVHNTGILGRLDAEIVENADVRAARALRGIGATRAQIAFAALAPANLGRALLYFFYRWETCVREATVLGLLGFVSLGWYVQEARASARYDEMVHWIALGSLLILLGDAVSGLVRKAVRNR